MCNLIYLLLGGVIKLVLVGPTEALLDTTVRPQSFHCRQQLLRERLSVLHPCYHINYHFCIRLQTTTPCCWLLTTNDFPIHTF